MSYKTEFASNCVDFQTILDKINKLGVILINFIIDGASYQAEDGMTFREWCDTDYNTKGWYVDSVSNQIKTATKFLSEAYADDKIKHNMDYPTGTIGGGSDD